MILRKLSNQCSDVKSESCLKDTCDQTAMQVARNEGMIEGVEMLNEAYEELLEDAE